MLMRYRRCARYVAAALLVSFGTLGAPHSVDPHHDGDWAVAAIPHDESAHQLDATDADSGTHPVHCLACHWARSFKTRTVAAHVPAHHFRSAKLVATDAPFASSSHAVVQPPLRAPPVVRNSIQR
jgi:hypothetical protein